MSTLEALSIAAQFTVRDRERAATSAELIVVADNLAQETGGTSGLNWDAIAATVAFTYQSANQPRTVWIENQYSAAFKAEFVRLWGLGGVAVDDASNNQGFSSIWPAIVALSEGRDLPLLQPNSSLLRPEWLVNNSPYQAGRATITWQTPAEPGTYAIVLIVSDGEMLVQNTDRIALRAGPPRTATPTPAATATGSPRPAGATPTPRP
jgi:hypothetical protein